MSDIEDLTYRRMNNLIDAIEDREQKQEYIGRLHAGVGAIATIKALNAAFEEAEVTLEELVGKPLNEQLAEAAAANAATEPIQPQISDKEAVNAWKQIAEQRGLKTS